ncbi:hypothetical protein AAVH_01595 [Aphelenchoides avenae]|nr:hypothetical protein AAVH_01595 [Aphelenchus avenae]
MPFAECAFEEERCFNKPCSAGNSLCYEHCDPSADAALRQCEYVSNRTRLRCPNIRPSTAIDYRGFCDAHAQFIARIERNSARQRKVLDPGFQEDAGLGECLRKLGATEDELRALDFTGRSIPEDDEDDLIESINWPLVAESACCEARLLDSEDNPLRNAKAYDLGEVPRLAISAAERQVQGIGSYRGLLCDKLKRLYATYRDVVESDKKRAPVTVPNGDKRMKLELNASRRYHRNLKSKRSLQLFENAEKSAKRRTDVKTESDGCAHYMLVKRPVKVPHYASAKHTENGNSVESAVKAVLKDVIDWVSSAEQTGELVERQCCGERRIPFSDYCLKHILEDKQQQLLSKCVQCGDAALIFDGKLCHKHAVAHSPTFAPLLLPKSVMRPSRSGSLVDSSPHHPGFVRLVPQQSVSVPEVRWMPGTMKPRRTTVHREGWLPGEPPAVLHSLAESESDSDDEADNVRTAIIDIDEDEADQCLEDSQRFQYAYAELRRRDESRFGVPAPLPANSALILDNGSSRESFEAADEYEMAEYPAAKQQATIKKKPAESGCARVRPFVGKDGRTDGNTGTARRNSVPTLSQAAKGPETLVSVTTTSFIQQVANSRKPSAVATERKPNGTNYFRAAYGLRTANSDERADTQLEPTRPPAQQVVTNAYNGSPEHRPITIVRKTMSAYAHRPVAQEPPPQLHAQAHFDRDTGDEEPQNHVASSAITIQSQTRVQAGAMWDPSDAYKEAGRSYVQMPVYQEHGYQSVSSPAQRSAARRVITPRRTGQRTLISTQNGTGPYTAVAMPVVKGNRLLVSQGPAWQANKPHPTQKNTQAVRIIRTAHYPNHVPRDGRFPLNGTAQYVVHEEPMDNHLPMRGAPTHVRANGVLKRGSNAARGRPQVLRREPVRNVVVPSNAPHVLQHPSTVYEQMKDANWDLMEVDEPTVVATPTYSKLSKPPVGLHMLANAATAQVPTDSEPQPPVPALPTSTKSIVQTAMVPVNGFEDEEEEEL